MSLYTYDVWRADISTDIFAMFASAIRLTGMVFGHENP